MASAVKLSDNIVDKARLHAKVSNRSIAGQIEYWAKIGKCAEDNPDLSYTFIKDILTSKAELDLDQAEPYDFE